MQSNIALDADKLIPLLKLPEDYFALRKAIAPEDLYKVCKDLFTDTDLEKYFTDAVPTAYIEQKTTLEDGCFICLRTSYNADRYISFVVKDSVMISYYEHFLTNYSGYKCYCTPDGIVHEDIGYGFGSWSYYTYDLNGNELSHKSKQEYGSCCD